MEDYSKPTYASKDAIAAEQQRFMVRVYNWMGAGLAVTGVTSFFVSHNEALVRMIFSNRALPLILMFILMGISFYLNSRIQKMSVSQATGIFIAYAGLWGVALSFIFIAYTASSIASTFLITAGTFGAMSLYGYTTKKDITSWGSFLYMGVVGLFIASLTNYFLMNETIYWITSYIGVFIFVGLTAYDTQKVKEMNVLGNEGTDEDTKEAIIGALTLFIDFIMLFVYLLRIMGDRR